MSDGGIKHAAVIKYHLDSELIHNTYVELQTQLNFKRSLVRCLPELLSLEHVHAIWLDIQILLDLQQDTKKSFPDIIQCILFHVECNTGQTPHLGVQFQNPEHVAQIREILKHPGVQVLMSNKDFFASNQRAQAYQALLSGEPFVGMYVHQLLTQQAEAQQVFPFRILAVAPMSPALLAQDVMNKLRVSDNVQTVRLISLTELCSSLLNELELPDAICVDVDVLTHVPDTCPIDVINMIITVCNLHRSEYYTQQMPSIYVNVKPDTDLDLIRKIMNIPHVNGLSTTTDFSLPEMQTCVQDIKKQHYHVPDKIKMRLDNHKCKSVPVLCGSHEIRLTVREQQIMAIICQKGYSNKMIANHLKITESAVKLHIGNILKKHRVKNRTELAIRVGRVDPPHVPTEV